MAYYINPDGTITTVEADYDRNGNLKPKINCELLNEQEITYSTSSASATKNTKGTIRPKGSVPCKKKKTTANTNKSTKGKLFINTAEIDLFFKDRIATRKGIGTDEYIKITDNLPIGLKDYFIRRYREYLGLKWGAYENLRNRNTFKKPKNKKKVSSKKKASHAVKDVSIRTTAHTGFSLGEIATFSPMNKQTPDGDMVNGRSLFGASRKPKYGYARDRYGRVQERDSFNEERRNEFHQSQHHQKNYDYSSYDENDDHDGAYSNWE